MRALLLGLALLLSSSAAANEIGPLPEIADIDGWTRAAEHAVYRGSELYGHINGGSEVYLELGFDHLVVQRYSDGDEHEVIAEMYVMEDPIAALGVYMMKVGKREFPNPGLTCRHSLIPAQLVMVESNVFAVVFNPGGDTGKLPLVAEVGRAISREIEDAPDPAPFDALPAEGRVKLSERVVRGQFTLQQLFTLGDGDVLQLQGKATAVAAGYESPDGTVTVIAATYRSDAEAKAAFAHLLAHLDSYLEPLERSDERLVFEDHRGRFGTATVQGRGIEIQLNLARQP